MARSTLPRIVFISALVAGVLGVPPAFASPSPNHGPAASRSRPGQVAKHIGTRGHGAGATYVHRIGNGADPGDLLQGPGPVMHTATVYLDFWLPNGHFDATAAGDTTYENTIKRFINDMSGTPYYGMLTQYFDGSGAIQNSVTVGGTAVSTHALPHTGTTTDPLTFQNIVDEAHSTATANGWTEDDNHITIVFTASGIQSCKGSSCTFGSGGYCAYHNYAKPTGSSSSIVFAYLPQADSIGGCDPGSPYPNSKVLDTEINVLSHEVFEAVTDPHLNGTWQDAANGGSGENGDKCNFTMAPKNDLGADVYLHGNPYLVQQEWSNAVHTCAIDLQNNSVVPPTVSYTKSVDDTNPSVGQSVNYTLGLNNSNDTGAATNLVVSDNLPAGYSVTAVSAPGSTTNSFNSGSVTVKYDTLAVHQDRQVVITATVPNQPEQAATNCGGLALQNLLTQALPGQQTNPCAQTTPLDQQVSLAPLAVSFVEGLSFSGAVAQLFDPDPNASAGEYVGNISWGDGSPTDAATITGPTGGPFDVSGTHTYLEEGVYTVSVQVFDLDNAGNFATTSRPDTVLDAPLTPSPSMTITSANPVNVTLATFTDADPNGTLSDYTATINWGDGSPVAAGTINTAGSGFSVSGAHTYPAAGPFVFAVTVHVCDVGGSCFSVFDILRITYMTGRAFGFTGTLDTPPLLLGSGSRAPKPDTGFVARSLPYTAAPPCLGTLSLFLVVGHDYCVSVQATTGPPKSVAQSTVLNETLNTRLPNVPVIKLYQVQAESSSVCGSASGSTRIASLVVGNRTIAVTGAPNQTIPLGLPGAKLIINEQIAVNGPGGDRQLTVNAVHLIIPKIYKVGTNLIIASATSDIHNCP